MAKLCAYHYWYAMFLARPASPVPLSLSMPLLTNGSDQDWERLARTDPYYAVVTEPKYHGELSDVLVGQNQLGTGALDSRFTVQSNDSTTIRIPIDFTYAGIGSAATQMMQQGSVPYTITGDVTVGTPLGNFTRPYTGTGRFSAFGGAQNSR